MRSRRCFSIFPLLFLLSTLVRASPIYPPTLSPRILGGLEAREKPNVGLQVGMPVVVTITVPGVEPTTACIQRTGSTLDVCSEQLPSPSAMPDEAPINEVQEPANTFPVILSVPPIRTPEEAVQEATATVPCSPDPSPNGVPGVDVPPFESNSPGAFVPIPSAVEQESTTTIHITTTVTEYMTVPPPTASTPAQQPDPRPPLLTPSPSTPQFTALPSSSSIASDTSVCLPPEDGSTSSPTSLTTSTSSTPVPVPEATNGLDSDTPGSDDSGPIVIIPVS